MTTDNRTNELTAEQIVSEALGPYGLIGRARDLAARNAVERLRAHGLLSEGTPSEAQVEAAAEAIHNLMQGDPSFKDSGRKREMRIYARAALVAAQGATTEELAKIKPLFENLSREYPNECNKRVKAEAERDAALAAIERVRAEANAYAKQPDVMEPCGAVAQSILLALDGAPERLSNHCQKCGALGSVETHLRGCSLDGARARGEALIEAVQAHRNLHKTYGSTAACHGGIGGQAMTPHCASTCYNHDAHQVEVDAWHVIEGEAVEYSRARAAEIREGKLS